VAQPGIKPGLLKNHKSTTKINRTPTEDSCHDIGPSSLYLFSMTAAATRSPCCPISMARASLLSGLKRPMYITCSHNHVSKPINSIGGTEYNIQEAKFMPGLLGKRLKTIINFTSIVVIISFSSYKYWKSINKTNWNWKIIKLICNSIYITWYVINSFVYYGCFATKVIDIENNVFCRICNLQYMHTSLKSPSMLNWYRFRQWYQFHRDWTRMQQRDSIPWYCALVFCF